MSEFKTAQQYAAEKRFSYELEQAKRWSKYETENKEELTEIYKHIEKHWSHNHDRITLKRESALYEPNSINQKELELFNYLQYKGFKPESMSLDKNRHAFIIHI